jgi:hypothetical protein
MTADHLARSLAPQEASGRDELAARRDVRLPREVTRFAGLPREQQELLLHVHDLLADIPFGTVVLVTQDGSVIQIETSEKIRLR